MDNLALEIADILLFIDQTGHQTTGEMYDILKQVFEMGQNYYKDDFPSLRKVTKEIRKLEEGDV